MTGSPQNSRAAMARVAPHSEEAEQSCIGAVLTNQAMFYPVAALISEPDFFLERHRIIWRMIAKMTKAGRPVDLITVSDALRDASELELVGGLLYLGDLINNCPGVANGEHYAFVVADHAKRRAVIAFATELTSAAYGEKAEQLMAMAGQGIDSLMRKTSSKSLRFEEMARNALTSFEAAGRARANGQMQGATSGLTELDLLTGGFFGPRLIVLAARPKCGKTALLNQIALESAMNGKAGLLCSLEMGANELMARAIANYSGVNVTMLMRGKAEGLNAASAAIGQLGDLPLWIDTDTTELNSVCAQIALHKARHGIQWAAVDHIGLVNTQQRFNSRNDQIGHISWTLKQLAKRLDIPILLLSQLSRQCDKDNRRPRADDLRDSGNIEQDADMVLMLHVPAKQRTEPVKQVEIGITANRAGPSCWMGSLVQFEGITQRFTETNMPSPEDYES